MSPQLRSGLVLVVGLGALALAADAVVRAPGFEVPRDFPEYWASGRVNLRGGNPYHPGELLPVQQAADPGRTDAVMMWNPPPALAVYMPLGALAPRWAALLWVGLQLAAVFVACDLLWRVYGGPHRWAAALVGLSCAGTWWMVGYGQNTGLLALGLAGFLFFRTRDRPLAAGACAALTALKPHLLACFGVLLVADALTRAGAKALAAGVVVVAAALGAAVLTNPAVIGQFVEAARNPAPGATPLSDWWLPVPAFWLRKWFAPGDFWVQFVPCAVACLACCAWRGRLGSAWNWARALPLVVAVCVLTTPYGGWVFDLPVLVVPAVWAAGRLVRAGRFALAGAFVVGQGALTALALANPGGLHEYWWLAPASLLLCLLGLTVPERSSGSGTMRPRT